MFEDRELLLTEEILVLATIVGSVATLPFMFDFLRERRKRKERIDIALEETLVSTLQPRLAGMDGLLTSIADLIDRAGHPEAYRDLKIGNEVLIIGPSMSGKKTLAERIAKDAHMDRLITVYNARDVEALAYAKGLLHKYRRQKVMILLPRLDVPLYEGSLELRVEIRALIETISERDNVLIVGTAIDFEPQSELDDIFGIKLVLPGTNLDETEMPQVREEARQLHIDVARFYLQRAQKLGFVLTGMTDDAFVTDVTSSATNPAEIEDIVSLCQTAAIFRKRNGSCPNLAITPEILAQSIGRVIVTMAARHSKAPARK